MYEQQKWTQQVIFIYLFNCLSITIINKSSIWEEIMGMWVELGERHMVELDGGHMGGARWRACGWS